MSHERQSRMVEYRRGLARYTPIARIATGGMGEVWRGEATFPDGHVEEVAIKRMLPWLSEQPMYRLMLEDEARLGMLLRHDNIVRVYDARMQGSFILVMEYVEGRSLNQVLDSLAKRTVRLPLAAALHVARELTRALEYAHGAYDEWGRELAIIHGDVSPHNVLASVHGDVKLMDFGLARATANLVQRDPKKVSGKSGYVAPELVSHHEASQLNDLFALGVVVWECLAGRRLFKGKNPMEDIRLVRRCDVPQVSLENPAVPPELDEVVSRMLAREPADRYQSARELGKALDRCLPRYERGLGRGQLAHVIRDTMRRNSSLRPPATTSRPPAATTSRPPSARREDPLEEATTGVYHPPFDLGTSTHDLL